MRLFRPVIIAFLFIFFCSTIISQDKKLFKRYFADVEYVNKQIASCELAKHLMKQPVEVKHVDLVEKVNYAPENYNPVIPGDGRTMVYMVNKPFYRAIMISQRVNEEWTNPGSKE